jgi:hypothetical protein
MVCSTMACGTDFDVSIDVFSAQNRDGLWSEWYGAFFLLLRLGCVRRIEFDALAGNEIREENAMIGRFGKSL